MATFLTVLIFVLLYAAISRLIGPTILNIVGLPGALLGYKTLSVKEPRYVLGVILSAIFHSYVYFAYM
ncbi:MAG: hypothetical protein SGJ02_12765, partial [bacterium]|nr:hypothetical protein [bacterium]